MRAMPALRLIYTLSILSLILVSGCILSPEEDITPPDPTDLYKPLTEPDNVIYNLVQSYRNADIARYTELLHPDYIWYNQTQDVSEGYPEFYTGDEDISSTTNMFLAKQGLHPDETMFIQELNLIIYAATTDKRWQEISDLNGTPCLGCYQTTRVYEITVQLPTKTLYGNDEVVFTVAPVIENEKTLYKLLRADDMRM